MMGLLTKLVWLLLLIPSLAFGGFGYQVSGKPTQSAGVSPDFSEDFNTANTGDVATNTDFDTELDGNSELDINSNRLRYYASTVGRQGYATASSTFDNVTEVTATMIVRFEDITNVDGGGSSILFHRMRSNASVDVAEFRFVASGGDVYSYRVCRGTSAECNDVVMTGVAADTDYYCYFYAKVDGSVGGAAVRCDTDADISDSSWAEATTGFNDDNSANLGIGLYLAGVSYNGWGDGTTDTYLYTDDLNLYGSDQR